MVAIVKVADGDRTVEVAFEQVACVAASIESDAVSRDVVEEESFDDDTRTAVELQVGRYLAPTIADLG